MNPFTYQNGDVTAGGGRFTARTRACGPQSLAKKEQQHISTLFLTRLLSPLLRLTWGWRCTGQVEEVS